MAVSGPAILQISSYWEPGDTLHIDLAPGLDVAGILKQCRTGQPNIQLKNALKMLPRRLLLLLLGDNVADMSMQSLSNARIQEIAQLLHDWQIKPNGTEGYRTAEVTVGGIDCNELSSKTMESKLVTGLYFIGEVVDVTGWLGGYNFQWAWSSGWCAGQVA